MRTNPFLLLAAVASVVIGVARGADAASRPNVLFIAIDDLRSDLGALGVKHARTPQLDAFAATARVFSHHYVQVPTCGASRCALLRGRYPSQPAHLANTAIAKTHANWGDANLPAWFKRHGYRTLALGKITHHPGGLTGRHWAEGPEELPGAWTRSWIPEAPWKTPEAMMHGYANGKARVPGKTPPWEAFDGPDDAYPDFCVANEAVATLRELARSKEPWFFAVGLFKPHLPFAAPKRFYNQHDAAAIPVPLATQRPEGPSSWHRSGEFRGNYGHEGRDPETDADYARQLRHAYAAATSYVDAQAGRVLQAVNELGLARNTIVVVWGDHGFLLGEHGIWGKHCLYEEALRSPLMIRVPNLARAGDTSRAIVETVDVFPTLAELCGLPIPSGLDGRSLRPQLIDPDAKSGKPAIAYWTSGQRTFRDERWRLIAQAPGKAGEPPPVELFDLVADPAESRDVSERRPDIVAALLAKLPAQLQTDAR